MTDRELLEMAAKAAGIAVAGLAPMYMCKPGTDLALIVASDQRGETIWNPLTDDGDAFRLLVRLGMLWTPELSNYIAIERFAGQERDDCSAHRRAIVRAAAALGRTK